MTPEQIERLRRYTHEAQLPVRVADLRALLSEWETAEARLAKVEEIARDGQSRDALHAFDALLRIQQRAAAQKEDK